MLLAQRAHAKLARDPAHRPIGPRRLTPNPERAERQRHMPEHRQASVDHGAPAASGERDGVALIDAGCAELEDASYRPIDQNDIARVQDHWRHLVDVVISETGRHGRVRGHRMKPQRINAAFNGHVSDLFGHIHPTILADQGWTVPGCAGPLPPDAVPVIGTFTAPTT